MSIEQTNVVDLISRGEKSDSVFLTITDHFDWSDDVHGHLWLLQEKINTYLSFVESGEIDSEYPKGKGKKKSIRIALKFEPNDHGVRFLESVRARLASTDIGFEFKVFDEG